MLLSASVSAKDCSLPAKITSPFRVISSPDEHALATSKPSEVLERQGPSCRIVNYSYGYQAGSLLIDQTSFFSSGKYFVACRRFAISWTMIRKKRFFVAALAAGYKTNLELWLRLKEHPEYIGLRPDHQK